jgi:hypothetical protein
VRITEDQARESNAPPATASGARIRRGAHPDQEQAAKEIAQALSGALGAEVTVKVAVDGYRAELAFSDPQEALELARRLRPRTLV